MLTDVRGGHRRHIAVYLMLSDSYGYAHTCIHIVVSKGPDGPVTVRDRGVYGRKRDVHGSDLDVTSHTTRTNAPVEELLVALPIVNASRVPDDPQSERQVFRPRLGEQSVDSRGGHIGREALECVQRARERRAERRGSVLGHLVMGEFLGAGELTLVTTAGEQNV